jgi:hypothetical protein
MKIRALANHVKRLKTMKLPKVGLTTLILTVGKVAYADDLLGIYQQALEADPELKSSETKIKIGTAQKGQALGKCCPRSPARATGLPTTAPGQPGGHAKPDTQSKMTLT